MPWCDYWLTRRSCFGVNPESWPDWDLGFKKGVDSSWLQEIPEGKQHGVGRLGHERAAGIEHHHLAMRSLVDQLLRRLRQRHLVQKAQDEEDGGLHLCHGGFAVAVVIAGLEAGVKHLGSS